MKERSAMRDTSHELMFTAPYKLTGDPAIQALTAASRSIFVTKQPLAHKQAESEVQPVVVAIDEQSGSGGVHGAALVVQSQPLPAPI